MTRVCAYCGGSHREAFHFDVISAPAAARPWIRDSFLFQLLEMDGGPRECAHEQKRALMRVLHLGAGACVIAVPRGYCDDFVGWALELNGSLAFAYVREPFRRQGIASAMLCELPVRLPLVTAYWTDTAEAIAQAGFPIGYDIHAYRALLAFVRGKEPTKPTTEKRAA